MDKNLVPIGNQIKKPPDKGWNYSSTVTSCNSAQNDGFSKPPNKSQYVNNGPGSSSDDQNSKSSNPHQYTVNGSSPIQLLQKNKNKKMVTNLDEDLQSDNFSQQSHCNDDIQSNYISQDEDFDMAKSSGDEIDYEIVKNKKYKRNSKGDLKIDLSKLRSVDIISRPCSSQNRFSILENLNLEANEINNVKKNPVTKKQSIDNKFCPPIFLYGVNIKSLVEQLKAKELEFKIINKSNLKSKLYLKDVSAHSEMMLLLREKNIESYSFTPSELRRQSLVLRGLYYDTNVSDIETDLNKLVPDTVQSVSKFTTAFSKKNNLETGLFLITLKEGKRLNDLTSIRFILNQVITWEKPKRNQKVVQCYRCQNWGHMSKNCNRSFACVKCSSNHEPGKCLFIPDSNSQPFCSNCQSYGHPASWRGCPSFKKYLDLKKKISDKAKEKRNQVSNNVSVAINSSCIDPSRSFASHFSNESQNKPNIVNEFLKIAKVLCEPDSLEVRIMNFMKNFKSISKFQAIAECKSLLQEVLSTYGP